MMEHRAIDLPRQAVGVTRVALLVDGDNLSPSFSQAILDAAAQLGRLDLRRVYAAEAGHKAWEDAAGFRVFRVAGAKNGTDLLLCIEAVAAACRDGFDTFVIASDDRDFTHLAHWLREQGLHVLGLGTAKSPDGWRAACSRFEVLRAEEPKVPQPSRAVATSDIDRRLRLVIGRQAAGRPMMEVGSLMARDGVLPPSGGKWRAYMAARPEFYDLDPQGPKALVRWVGA